MEKIKFIFLFIIYLSLSSCKKNSLQERTISFAKLKQPTKDIDIELLSYHPAKNLNQSNLYLAKDLKNGDTIYIFNKENSPISNFIKNYDGVQNTALVLRRGKFQKKNAYYIFIPEDYNLNSKKIYLGKIIRLVE